MKYFISFFLTTALASSVLAHSPLAVTNPTNGAAIETAPSTIDLTFGQPAVLIRLTVKVDDGAPVALTIPTKQPSTQISVPNTVKSDGNHLVEWRIISADGHPLKGEFQYTVKNGE